MIELKKNNVPTTLMSVDQAAAHYSTATFTNLDDAFEMLTEISDAIYFNEPPRRPLTWSDREGNKWMMTAVDVPPYVINQTLEVK